MKKARLILSAVFLSAMLSACSTSMTAPEDCPPENTEECGWPGSDS